MKKYRSVATIILERDIENEKKYLLVRKPRKYHAWQFPQGGVDNGETFLDAARRELKEECGDELQIKFISEEAVGEYQYDFPSGFKRHDEDILGARVMFFSAKWVSGEAVVDENEIVEARWVTKRDIEELVEREYWEVIEGLLVL